MKNLVIARAIRLISSHKKLLRPVSLILICANDDDTDQQTQRQSSAEKNNNTNATVCLARSLKDIESVGFTYNEEKEELPCSVCTTTEGSHMNHANNTNKFSANGIFKYESQVTGVSFSPDQCLPEKFRNLKKHVRRHIKLSSSHVQNLRSQM